MLVDKRQKLLGRGRVALSRGLQQALKTGYVAKG
jgi:hypothetical protein